MNSLTESLFEYRGYTCVVKLMKMGHRCGYVALPKTHPLYDKEYDKIDIDCHGGLTFGSMRLDGQPNKGVYWIGFDCAHAYDRKDLEACRKAFPDQIAYYDAIEKYEKSEDVVRTKEFVEAECRHIVDQILEMR